MDTTEATSQPEAQESESQGESKKAGAQEKKIGELTAQELINILTPLAGSLIAHYLNSPTGPLKEMASLAIEAQYKANICYELLTEEQKKEAREKLQKRYEKEGVKYTSVEKAAAAYGFKV